MIHFLSKHFCTSQFLVTVNTWSQWPTQRWWPRLWSLRANSQDHKRNWSSLEKWLILELVQEIYKMTVGHCIKSENKEDIKDDCGCLCLCGCICGNQTDPGIKPTGSSGKRDSLSIWKNNTAVCWNTSNIVSEFVMIAKAIDNKQTNKTPKTHWTFSEDVKEPNLYPWNW